ncbi:class I SAM-dependent methyltransferase [Hyphobacterium marinum]|uniref:Class I SAM-dependent methyltransferase n=1 Tax=Hyphobacterium marinum TaxID=3116574 RepID=A0ABU7LUD1_9PROT|nr:class I SAM-dependent methyltransferase [Hyphobacterium sp. Y6023]MEE2565167.1 class I SAM-dependent methyltransferase [Hyphobacterium sp. Y6023]
MTIPAESPGRWLDALADRINGLDEADHDALQTYLGESRIGHDLIAPVIEPGLRVLEVGSGIGALGHYLASRGIDIRGIEPAESGFDRMSRLAERVSAAAGTTGFSASARSAEDLDPDTDGSFDLIYSVHVLEHLPDPEAALAAMNGVLKPGGTMVHLCPNYRFAYDPHFAIPIPFWSPALTRAIFARRIEAHREVWDGLNFIGAGRLARIARTEGLSVRFHPGVMAATFARLNNDPVFRARHDGLAGRLAGWTAKGPFAGWLRAIPPQWASPMAVTLSKPV